MFQEKTQLSEESNNLEIGTVLLTLLINKSGPANTDHTQIQTPLHFTKISISQNFY